MFVIRYNGTSIVKLVCYVVASLILKLGTDRGLCIVNLGVNFTEYKYETHYRVNELDPDNCSYSSSKL